MHAVHVINVIYFADDLRLALAYPHLRNMHSRVKSERLRQFTGSPFHGETSSIGEDWMADRTSPRVEIARSNQTSRGAEDQEDMKYSTPVSLDADDDRRSFIRSVSKFLMNRVSLSRLIYSMHSVFPLVITS